MSARFRRRVIDLESRSGSAQRPVPRPSPEQGGRGTGRDALLAGSERGRRAGRGEGRRPVARGPPLGCGGVAQAARRVLRRRTATAVPPPATISAAATPAIAAVLSFVPVSARSEPLSAAGRALLFFMVLSIQPA